MNKSTKTLLSLSLPSLLIILSCLFLTRISSMSVLIIGMIPFLPYILLLIAGVLAYRFNQSKIFYLALVFILIQFTTEAIIYQRHHYDSTQMNSIYSVIGILVPLNIFIYCFLKERGIFSQWGFLKLISIIGQFLGAIWIVSSDKLAILNILNVQLLPWTFDFLHGIAQLSLIVFCLSIISILLLMQINNCYFSATAIGILFSVALLIYFRDTPLAGPIFMSSTGLMMIICIIQNTYSMAYLDELTEIPGRRALREEMMKLSGNYVMAMVDIDFFKKFNDKYGHNVGDEVLRMVASKLVQVTGGGKAFRYGGEEFVIVFSGKKLADVLPHLEKLRENIAKADFSIRGKDRPKMKTEKIKLAQPTKRTSVTVSIGAAEKSNAYGKAQEVLTAADKALYRAKKNGRNRVCK
ncbi:MAG: GGDEF domain-containing protein [Firmicutes bacterium HGW-Firmicutes-15]|nr:MAG: GGDEF domain-containing protein [Firmicutes bacterium HGW-Firmicutes-15]